MKSFNSRIKSAVFVLFLFAVNTNAETILLNSLQYEKIDGQWYQIEGSNKYVVNNSVVTVKYADNVTKSQIDTELALMNCTLVRSNILGYIDVAIPANSDPLQMVQDFINSGTVILAELNTYGSYNTIPNDPCYINQWYHHDETVEKGIDSYKAWDKQTGNTEIKIAVLDSGTDFWHDDLIENIWVNKVEDIDGDGVAWDLEDINGIDDDCNGFIDDIIGWDFGNNNNAITGPYFHGTFVAGVAGASTNNNKGVAGTAGGWGDKKGCILQIIQIGDDAPSAEILDDAILYAAINGARVITMSLGVGYSTAIYDAIETAYDQYNCFITCASGNTYPTASNYSVAFPARNPFVVAVGATDKNGMRAPFSNYGTGLRVVAPGIDIWSTTKNNSYFTGDGTSTSSPQVAGVAGMIASRYPNFRNSDIMKVICLTTQKLPNYLYNTNKEYGTWNEEVGYGKLNADRALGITGNISSPQTLVEGNYICGQEVILTNKATMTCDMNSRTYLYEQTYLKIQAGSTLCFKSGSSFYCSEGSTIEIEVGGQLLFEVGSNLIVEGNAKIIGGIQVADGAHIEVLDNSTLSFQLSQLSITSGTTVKLGANAKMIIENGSNLIFEDGAVIELGEGAEIVVMNKGNLTADGTTFSYIGSTGKWLGINCEGGSSVSLNNVNITGAETGVRGVYNYKFSVTNSIFEACDKGISVTELVPTVSYAITGNTLTGTRAGTGVHVTSSNGIMKNNTISFFLYGARFTMCSPTVSNNTIFGNKIFGILVSGQNAIPQLINTDINQVAFPNNEIYNNGGTLNSPSELFLSAQIGIIPYANVYMYKGRNNIFSGIVNTTPLVPCISIAKLIASVNQNIIVKAAYNYWGSSSVNYDFFFEDHYQYSIEYTPYYVTPDGLVDPDEPNSQSSSTENKILTNAIRLESKDNVIPAIKLYEHIIKKYVDTAEYYIAMARLPYLYAIAELDNNELIAIYDEAYASEKTTNKKFFKGMKVATHIKGKRYDDAIAVAEEMKSEAEFDEEVTLADINIAIANLLKEMEGKSRSGVDYAENLHGLLSKLNSSEVTGSGEPTDITESVLPSEIKLYQNYPNPFNPVTQINFALAKNAQVKLSVYNISGQKVAELVNGTKQAGNHAVDFDGSKLNSGVYYYTLEVDGKSLTQKMILMK